MSAADVSILIVGAGFSGIGMGIRLLQAGITDFTVVECGDDVGGTWRDNHYPGAACDVESPLYSFSFEPYPHWTRMYAPQAEILAYLKHCVDKYGLRPHLRLSTAVTQAAWNDSQGLWEVGTSDGRTVRARVLVPGCGGLSRPSLPDIAGLARFGGKMFHTARWDKGYSLRDKTVALIGTGASAIQVVPSIAPQVGRLHVFQRTPPWIIPKLDREIPLHERQRWQRLPILQQLVRLQQYCMHELSATGFVRNPKILKMAERLAHWHLNKGVRSPELRARLRPSYRMGCKRILISNDYYPALERPNVELITDPIREISERGVITQDGRERAVDALILATGFYAAESVAPFPLRGRGGRELEQEWAEGAEAYLGSAVAGFPNLFFLVGPNTGLGHSSMIYMIESQVAYILDCLQHMRARGLKCVEVKAEVQDRYNQQLHARFPGTVWSTGCVSWYRTRSGKNTTLWPGFTFEFRRKTRRFDLSQYDVEALADSRAHGA